MSTESTNPSKLTTVHPVAVDTIITNNKSVTPRVSSTQLHIDLPPHQYNNNNNTTSVNTSYLQRSGSTTSSNNNTPSTPPTGSHNQLHWEIDLEALLPCYASMLSESSIELVSNTQHWNAVLNMIMIREARDCVGHRILGFAAECKHRPHQTHDNNNNTTTTNKSTIIVLQLAFSTTTVVLQLSLFDSIPDTLKQLLESDSIIKLGIGIHHISDILYNTYNIQMNGKIDICEIVCAIDNNELTNNEHKYHEPVIHTAAHYTLQSICESVLHIHLDSGSIERRLDWDASTLTRRQVLYAASDAYFSRKALLYLYQRIQPHSTLINLSHTLIGPNVSNLHPSPRIENTHGLSRRSSISRHSHGNTTHSPRHHSTSLSPSRLSRSSSSSQSTSNYITCNNDVQSSPIQSTRSPSPLTTHKSNLHATSPLPTVSRSPLKMNTIKPLHTHISNLSLSSTESTQSTVLNAETLRENELTQFIKWCENILNSQTHNHSSKSQTITN